jgi:hypothetical protein
VQGGTGVSVDQETIIIGILATMNLVQWFIQYKKSENKLDRGKMMAETPEKNYVAGVRDGMKFVTELERIRK